MRDCNEARKDMSVAEMVDLIRNAPPGPWPKRQHMVGGKKTNIPEFTWACWENTKGAIIQLADEFVATELDRSPRPSYGGRGVVICGGAAPVPRCGLGVGGYLPCVWVGVNKLRELGCTLPIQLWHLGPLEMDPFLARLLARLGVECVDAREVEKQYPCRINCGWEAKMFASLYSPFEEVLFLDADCAPANRNPEEMFSDPEYKRLGAVWFRDYECWRLKPGQWAQFGLPHYDEPALESGQFLVNKARCFRELRLALWYAEYSDYTFEHVYGDKECPHLAWRRLGTDYAQPVAPGWECGAGQSPQCIVQHDLQGRRQFMHRCKDKWHWARGKNKFCDCLEDEQRHHDLAEEFRRLWNGKLWSNPEPNEYERIVMEDLAGARFEYARMPQPGFRGDMRPMRLLAGGGIGEGGNRCETRWAVHETPSGVVLAICGDDTPTCLMRLAADSVWRGFWLEHERCAVELRPLPEAIAC